jgi:hydroxymethylglutaryl-CoA reductase (NADPH)
MVAGYGLGKLVGRVSLHPIETIVTFFILTTLAYFQILSAIKHSHFLTPIHTTSTPVLAGLNSNNEWTYLSSHTRTQPAVEIVQLQLSIPGEYPALQSQLTTEIINKPSKGYESACFVRNNSCLTSIRPETYSFTFDTSKTNSAPFVHALNTAVLNGEKDGTNFEVIRQHESIADMKSGKWVAYAGRALVLRFWSLAKVSRLPSNPFRFPLLSRD